VICRVVDIGEPTRIGHVMNLGIQRSHKLAEIRCPTRRLIRRSHVGSMMVHRLEARDLDAVSGAASAEGTIAETARTVGRRVNEGAIAREPPTPAIRRSSGTRSSRPTLSATRGLVFASAERMASRSAGSAMSSKRSTGGKRCRMIRCVWGQVARTAFGSRAFNLLAHCRESAGRA